MTDPRERRASATPYREPATRAPTPVVRYALAGPATITIVASLGAVVLLMCGWVAVTQWHDPEMRGGGFAILAVVVACFLLPLVFMVGEGPHRHEVRVEVDRAAGTLILRSMRWPLRARVRTFPLSGVADAVVQSDDDGEAVRYMVFLLIDGKSPVPLVEGMWDTAKKRHETTAEAIRALLPTRPPLT